ncbi:hypothetical protein C6499_00885 [Candidatus Poribacteria bacterium]|nr:MAG: hypothetical protein C6499_00885 [Candidatus Poribacteria bacterium]
MATQIRKENNVTILEPSGRIVGHAVSELRQTILPDIEASETPRILINLENVNMMDSGGLGVLMEARTIASRKDGRIGVINVGKHIKNLIVLSRIVSLFEHYDSEEEAISALST